MTFFQVSTLSFVLFNLFLELVYIHAMIWRGCRARFCTENCVYSRKCAQVSLEGLMYIWLDFLFRMKVLNGFCMFNFRKLKPRFPSTLNDSSHMKCMFLLLCMFYVFKYIRVYLPSPLLLSPSSMFLSIALKFSLFLVWSNSLFRQVLPSTIISRSDSELQMLISY